jgi:reactive intermediate/imine deaminase
MAASAHNPEGVARPGGAYSQAVEACGGRTVYTSGQPPIDANGETIEGDFEAQATQVFENIQAVLEGLGGSVANVVKLTVFLTDISNYKRFGEVRSRYLKPPYPASTLVGVSQLVLPEWLLEVEAIAVLQEDPG